MKTWMKILMWFGLGASVGYFAGAQVGAAQERKRRAELEESRAKRKPVPLNKPLDMEDIKNKIDLFRQAQREYAGGATEGLEEILRKPATDDDDVPPMPTVEELEIDADIPQLHPEDLAPEIISEEEFNANIDKFDIETLLFFELDEVLYNEATQSIVEYPDQVIGVGTLFEFGGDPNSPVDVIYVRNRTFGTYFKIERIDDAFMDAVDGTAGPEDDAPEKEEEDDKYWDDV